MRRVTIAVLAFGITVATTGASLAGLAAPVSPPSDWREVTIPAGTRLAIVLDSSVGSDTSRLEEPVTAHLSRPVAVRGATVLAEGAQLSGVVTAATRSGKVKGRARVAVRFNTLVPRGDGQRYRIQTAS